MTVLRRFRATDLLTSNRTNLDRLTENYNISFYLEYLAKWPEYFVLAESPRGQSMGYVMGKVEGKAENWHGHVTALTVGPDYRRLGLGEKLMKVLEQVTIDIHNGYFVDLYVKVSNVVAFKMYEKLGYVIYQRIPNYYSGRFPDDAYDMRKPMPRDKDRKSIIRSVKR